MEHSLDGRARRQPGALAYIGCALVAALATHVILVALGGRDWSVDGPLPFLAGCALAAPLYAVVAHGRETTGALVAKALTAPFVAALIVFMLVPLGFVLGVYDNQAW